MRKIENCPSILNAPGSSGSSAHHSGSAFFMLQVPFKDRGVSYTDDFVEVLKSYIFS